jgi:hypothetical protein
MPIPTSALAIPAGMLLLGLRNPRIAEVLKAHGFSNEDLAEGWTLLQGVTRRLLREPLSPVAPSKGELPHRTPDEFVPSSSSS